MKNLVKNLIKLYIMHLSQNWDTKLIMVLFGLPWVSRVVINSLCILNVRKFVCFKQNHYLYAIVQYS